MWRALENFNFVFSNILGFSETKKHVNISSGCFSATIFRNMSYPDTGQRSTLTETDFSHRIKKSNLENWNEFCLFSRIREIFQKFKKAETSIIL